MAWRELKSSNIAAVEVTPERDGATATLQVRFNGGREYSYGSVPMELCNRLLTADSPGSFFSEHIRGKFASRRDV